MTERSWGGTTLADRRAARRQALLDVAERLAGEEGAAAVTVRSVCRGARLTDRYFYESFGGRDDLLLAAFERVADEARSALEEAVAVSAPQADVRARAAVSAFVALVLDAPHKGRLLLLEPFADPALGARSHRLLAVFTELVGGQLPGTVDEADRRMAAHALVGGVASLFAGWLRGTLDVPRERLEAHCVELVLAAMSR
ncbi:TetR/AcrR family transcriptional regulator [Streptomyces sp. NPDC017448]|uniref:TetR/AcrR family transcriptional regulator n=1 Tax=Streptomyces sp. NPDC017448 TaxID=3364996 RepID=UPI00379A52E5